MKLFVNTNNSLFIILSVFVFNLAVVNNLCSQDTERYLQINGTAELNMKPVSNAVITLYEENSKIKSVKTGSSGSFSFKLDMNKDYTIEVSKEGYISKKLRFITKIPDDVTGAWVREFAVGLVKYCEGVNYSVLNDPVDVIKYSVRRQDFDSDKTFVYKVKPRLENLYIDVDQCLADKYNNTLDEADKLLADKKYDEAREKYEQAMEMFPDEEYPEKQIDKINDMIYRDKNIENLFSRTINEADALYAQKRYDEALLKYKGALKLKPQETYLNQKISEIELLKAEQDAELQAKSEANANYNLLISKGNTAFAMKDYEMARQYFSQALEIKPDNYYPSSKLQELEVLISQKEQSETKKQEIVKEYNNTVSRADQLFLAKNYEEAKASYEKALLINPQESYPREKIAEIENMIKEQQEALVRAKKAEMDREYDAALAEGDNYYKLKDYEAAKVAYSKAASIKPDEYYPKQRLERINNLLAAEQEREQQALEKSYNDAIAAGENYINIKQYEQARQEFNKALGFKPGDTYASSKIAEINRIITEQELKAAADESRKKQYDEIIDRADGLKNLKEYINAKAEYNKALQIMPEEVYPRQQINEIDRIVAEQERIMAEKNARENNYSMAISKADGFFRLQEYEKAKAEYSNALTIMPDEIYPKNKISEIDNIIAAQLKAQADAKALNDAYDNAVRQADDFFSRKKYAQARSGYTTALNYKPGSGYPSEQITRIDNILAQQERIRQEEMTRDKEYESLILTADNLYNAADYNNAKENYQKALEVKPDELYPKQRIARINEIIKQLARQQTTVQTQSRTSTQASPRPKLADLVFKDDRERDRYLDDLKKKYPEGVTLETYKEKLKITRRYIIIRNNEAHEFRMVHFTNWGGKEYSVDGKPITGQYFESQTSPRSGEYFKEFEF